MRDDHVSPSDRENAGREGRARGRRSTRAGAVRAAPDAVPADSAAALPGVPHPADAEEVGLTAEEVALYRRRVAEGLYDSREVAEEVARRMMKRDDI